MTQPAPWPHAALCERCQAAEATTVDAYGWAACRPCADAESEGPCATCGAAFAPGATRCGVCCADDDVRGWLF